MALGAKIAAREIYRDPVRSSKSHVVKASGLRWVCLMLLVVESKYSNASIALRPSRGAGREKRERRVWNSYPP
jgi:hypothetical protein